MLWHIIQNVIGLTIAFREFATANPDIEDSTQGNVHPCKYHQPGNRGALLCYNMHLSHKWPHKVIIFPITKKL